MSFVDCYVLSHAQSVTLVREKKMYHSDFVLRAVKLNREETNVRMGKPKDCLFRYCEIVHDVFGDT